MRNMTAGEALRLLMKQQKVKQVDLSEKLEIDKRSVSRSLANFDNNKGTISTFLEYADALGFDVTFDFIEKKE